MTWFVVRDGRIVEAWDACNQDGLLATLGAGAQPLPRERTRVR